MSRLRRGLAAAVLLLGLGVVCRGAATASGADGADPAGPVVVFAAASLTEAFTRIGADFEATHPGTTVMFSFGSSATLAAQIVEGAPADVFAAASPETMAPGGRRRGGGRARRTSQRTRCRSPFRRATPAR